MATTSTSTSTSMTKINMTTRKTFANRVNKGRSGVNPSALFTLFTMFAVLALLITSIATPLAAQAAPKKKTINGAGASFAYPAYSTWAYYYKRSSGTTINYQSIGSSAGINAIISGEVSFAGTDAPLNNDELQKHKFAQFPTLTGAIVMVVNIVGVDGNKVTLNGDIISRIYAGKITNWKDKSIMALNPNLRLPDATIVVVHRSDGSGTTYAFTDYLSSASSLWKNQYGKDKVIPWPVGVGAKGNEGVNAQVKKIRNSIGYVELSFAELSGMDTPQLINLHGRKVKANKKSIMAAASNAKWDKANGYQASLVNLPGDNTWPIVTPTYGVINANSPDAKDIAAFFKWSFENGDDNLLKLGYIPLPAETKQDIITTILGFEKK